MNKNLKENVIHGDFNLPFSNYHVKFHENFNQIPIHWHEEIEVIYIEYGDYELNIDLESHTGKCGDIFFIKPFSLHSIKTNNNESTNILHSIVFDLAMLQSALADGSLVKYLAPIINNQNDLPLYINEDSSAYNEILKCLLNIFKCYKEKNKAYELKIKAYLFNLFSLLYEYDLINENTNSTLSKRAPENIRKILNYISDNYYNQLSIKDIAKVSGFSEFHFMKFFKKHIGITCIEYINLFRLEQAANMLVNTDKSIMNISLEVGFNNVSYFNKLFKNTYNLTPKNFRASVKI